MTSDLDRWLRLGGQHMTPRDSRFRLCIALWFSNRFSKSTSGRLIPFANSSRCYDGPKERRVSQFQSIRVRL
jgi:hypothetical protein